MKQIIPAKQVRNEIIIQNSRFIATLSPVFSLQEAKSFISQIKDEFPDATHNVPAYLIGHGSSVIAHCSDDREPRGTAGKPVLAVLKGSGFGDVAVVITRYFGGKKLGKGGLVRAYSEATKGVIDITPRASKTKLSTVLVRISYSLYDRIQTVIKQFNGVILEEIFSHDVSISAQIPIESMDNFNNYVQDLTRGELKYKIIKETESIMPLIDETTGT